jgi:homoserine O-acetyltransferase
MTVQHERATASLGEFRFECGESVPDLEMAYETYGEFTGDNAVLVCHALTGSAHVAGRHRSGRTAGQARAWWEDIVGPGKAIDTTEYHVVCANVPGSCYGGPTSLRSPSATGRRPSAGCSTTWVSRTSTRSSGGASAG